MRNRVLRWAKQYGSRRPPDFVIGNHQLERWWIIPRNNFFNVYLHRFNSSDEDRALHDHMYVNLSWILGPGGYNEVMPAGSRAWYPAFGLGATITHWRRPGAIVMRWPRTAHRIVVQSSEPVWSLFVTGPRVRQWGFWCPHGWRHWKEFTDARDSGQVGRGCE